jgi:hypothetical protein
VRKLGSKAIAQERELAEIRAQLLVESRHDLEALEAELAAESEQAAQTMDEFGFSLPETVQELARDSLTARATAAVL